MTIRRGLVIVAILLLIHLASCGKQDSPVAPNGDAVITAETAPLSAPVELSGATLYIWVDGPNQQTLNIHRITSDWDGNTVSWNSFGAAFSSDIAGSFTANSKGWYSVDVTALANSWTAEEHPNYGLLIEQVTPGFAPAVLFSSERSGYSPYLEICISTAGGPVCDTALPLADVFIDQAMPTNNTEGNSLMMVANMSGAPLDKQALIRFDLPTIVYEVDDASIGSTVWNDANKNGIMDPGESGFAGVVTNLLNCSGEFVGSTITDSTGQFLFDSLSAGDYKLEFSLPPDYVFSPANAGSDELFDSDADPLTGLTECFTVAASQHVEGYTAGIYYPVAADTSCTHDRKYWQHHSGFGWRRDLVGQFLPVWLGDERGRYSIFVRSSIQAKLILMMANMRRNSNGIACLYSELLAAKLNIAYGATPDEIADEIVEADAFLAEHRWYHWRRLDANEKRLVRELEDIFRQFNEGEIGPGSCD